MTLFYCFFIITRLFFYTIRDASRANDNLCCHLCGIFCCLNV
nr:MAG TPA: hypothetical protein [Caudoviricetes sp.]